MNQAPSLPTVLVQLPMGLRPHADAQSIIEVAAATVRDALEQVTRQHPALRPHLFDADGAPRDAANLYLNDENIRYLDGPATTLADGDLIAVVPAVAGGRPEPLTPEERARYQRHTLLPEVGEAGQLKLKEAAVLCIGAGGLGSPVALYLAAAGVGRIGLVDDDQVDASNLQRQILHGTPDLGRLKTDSGRDRIAAINPLVVVDTHPVRIDAANALDLIRPYDLVVDGSDNFPTRYLVNDACALLGKPCVYGSIYRFEGQASVFHAGHGPCYRCLFPEPPPPDQVPSCAEGGVLGVLPGLVGVIQATEAIKLILGIGNTLLGRLLTVDALTLRFRELALPRDPACPLCGDHPTITKLIDYQDFCGSPPPDSADITATALHAALERGTDIQLVDVRQPFEHELCRIEGSLLIPLDTLPARLGELDPKRDTVVYCRSGHRSAFALNILRDAGFHPVRNLTGGILAWADDIDPSLPRY